jgi:hypothetical protein
VIDKAELDQLKDISSKFSYEDQEDLTESSNKNEGELNRFKSLLSSLPYEKSERIGLHEGALDDFDTVYEALKTGIEQELRGFIKNLLEQNVENFIWSFVNPSTETFKHAWNHALTKFTVSDERMRDQFLERIRILYRSIFLEKMSIGNEADAIALGDAYYTVFKVAINQLFDKMKDNIEGETTPPAQDATTDELSYR